MTSSRTLSLICLFAFLTALCLCSCQHRAEIPPRAVVRDGVVVTLRDQKLTLFRRGKKVKDYPISSSKFGIGQKNNSNKTPVGVHVITNKIGAGYPSGAVFKNCKPTGQIVRPNARGRDLVLTRIIQIIGLEHFNDSSYDRRIYIHGTNDERHIGRPASYGCIRMKSRDVLDLYKRVYRGMPVDIVRCSQSTYFQAQKDKTKPRIRIHPHLLGVLPNGAYGSSRDAKNITHRHPKR